MAKTFPKDIDRVNRILVVTGICADISDEQKQEIWEQISRAYTGYQTRLELDSAGRWTARAEFSQNIAKTAVKLLQLLSPKESSATNDEYRWLSSHMYMDMQELRKPLAKLARVARQRNNGLVNPIEQAKAKTIRENGVHRRPIGWLIRDKLAPLGIKYLGLTGDAFSRSRAGDAKGPFIEFLVATFAELGLVQHTGSKAGQPYQPNSLAVYIDEDRALMQPRKISIDGSTRKRQSRRGLRRSVTK